VEIGDPISFPSIDVRAALVYKHLLPPDVFKSLRRTPILLVAIASPYFSST
jgi:hypothetical protein